MKGLEPSESSSHLGSQLPLPLVGALRGRAAAGTVAEDGTLCKVADVTALVEGFLSCLQSRLQLLPQQQVVPGLLHLLPQAQTNFTSLDCAKDDLQAISVVFPNSSSLGVILHLINLFSLQTDLLQ